MHYFKYLGDSESIRQLWENREALALYLAALKELMEPEETTQEPEDETNKDTVHK